MDITEQTNELGYDDTVPYYDTTSFSREVVQSFGPPTPVTALAPSIALTAPQRSRGKLFYGIIVAVSASVLLFAGGFAALFLTGHLSSGTNNQSLRASFAPASCPFTLGSGIVEGHTVLCGFVTTPEDPTHPGQKIQLAVAIFHPSHSYAHTIPLLFLQGGPGGALLGSFGSYITASNLDRVTMRRDLILLDQRGTGYSKPKLSCYEIQVRPQESFQQAVKDCHDRLVSQGIHLANYTTLTDAYDVHAVIHALGYQRADLYGVSYGTRLALTTMRLFPDDIQSVVLDSTVPTQQNLFKEEPVVLQHALDVLFAGCAASKKCNEAYPHLQSTFYHLVTNLDANPVTVNEPPYGSVLFTGSDLFDWITQSMYETEMLPELPRDVMQMSQGNFSALTQSSLIPAGEISDGVYYSVECGEDMAFTNPYTLLQAVDVMHPELRLSMQQSLQGSYNACQQWQQPAVPLSQKQAVVSAIPTLILAGEYDPITPPSQGRLAMKTLSHSYFFQFAGTGHGVFLTSSCAEAITTDFLNSPATQPNGSCLSSVKEPDFL